MKKTIAVLLVFALVLVGVFADPTVTNNKITLSGTVKENGSFPGGGSVIDPDDPSSYPAGVVVFASTQAKAGERFLLTDNENIMKDANLSDDGVTTNTSYYLQAYFGGNYGKDGYNSTVAIEAVEFKSVDDDSATLPVTTKATATDPIRPDFGQNVTVTTGSSENSASLGLTVPSNTVVNSSQQFGYVELSWKPQTNLPAGTYNCDVAVKITSSK